MLFLLPLLQNEVSCKFCRLKFTFVPYVKRESSPILSSNILSLSSLSLQCKEFLRPFKKSLRKLDLPKELPKDKKLKYTKKNLTILGDHINMFLQQYCKSWELKHWKKMLWRFVSLFSGLDAKHLRKLYKYSKSNQMAKFLKLYCSSQNPDSVPIPENTKLTKLYDAWGLRGDINNMQEKLSQIQSPPSQTSLQGDSEAASMTKKRYCCC
uniref:CHD1 helical C-terminal domain containing 1 n=1 Tax=Terrapene triunguis TaxID=2587831 RepID=A0A674KES8_9SAUR